MPMPAWRSVMPSGVSEMKLYTDEILYHLNIHQSDSGLPYLLLFHGFMGSSEIFQPLLPKLKPFCNPVSIDLAGHGKSVAPAGSSHFSAERQSTQIRSILERLSFSSLFIYGYSMGGRLLFQLITRYPGLIRGALFESTHCGIESPQEREDRIKLDKSRSRAILQDYDTFIDRWAELPLFKSTPVEKQHVYRSVMRKQNPQLMAASLSGFGSGVMPSVCRELQHLPTPLYLVAGEHDLKYVKRMSTIASMCSDCTFQIVKNAGHRVHTDRPEDLVQILKTFIKKYHV